MFAKLFTIASLIAVCACGAEAAAPAAGDGTDLVDVRASSRFTQDAPAAATTAQVAPAADGNCVVGKTEVSPYVCVNSAPRLEADRYIVTDSYVVSGNTVTAANGRSFLAVHLTVRNLAAERIYLNVSLPTQEGGKILGVMYGSEVVNQWLWSYAEPLGSTTGYVIFDVPAGWGLDAFAALNVVTQSGPEFLPATLDTQSVPQAYIPVQ